jgi:hypothetical protein
LAIVEKARDWPAERVGEPLQDKYRTIAVARFKFCQIAL